MTVYRRFGKRLFDLGLAVPAGILLLPVWLVTALFVRVKLGSPVVFRQQRPGQQGKPFTIYKFRTMTDARDVDGQLLPDAERLTKFGRFLRSSSLDELPELINVLKGEMSIVGPRPLLMRYYPYFTDDERLRFTVRPGITGLAQISGRNNLTWDARIATDVLYVKSISLGLDVQILLTTIRRVFARHGVQADPSAMMLDFDEERRARHQSQV